MQIPIHFNLDIEDLALELNPEQAMQLIKQIDKEQYCANFTFEVAEYFIREVLDFDEKVEWIKELLQILKDKK